MLRKPLFILFLFLHFNIPQVRSQSTFFKTYGSTNSEYGTTLCESPDSGLVLGAIYPDSTGSVIASVLFKTNRNGETTWLTAFSMYKVNVPVKVIRAEAGGYFFLSSSWDDFNSGNMKNTLVKVDEFGNIQWARLMYSSGSDKAVDLVSANNELYVIAVSDYNIPPYPGVLIYKLDINGNFLWCRKFTGTYGITPVAAAAGTDCIGIVASSYSYGPGSFNFSNNVLILCDTSGTPLQTTVTGTFYDDEAWSLATDGNQWVLSGRSYFLSSGFDMTLQWFDHDGRLVQSHNYDAGFTEGEAIRSVRILLDGSVVCAGDAGGFDERNVVLMKTDSLGNIEWSHQYPVSPLFTNYAFAVTEVYDGGFAFTGDMRPPAYMRDPFIIKTDPEGHIPCYESPIVFSHRSDFPDTLSVQLPEETVITTFIDTLPVIVQAPYTTKTQCEFLPPLARYELTRDSICPRNCYTLTDHSSGPVDDWEWSFPGGEPSVFSGSQPPPVCYNSNGTHSVTLTVTNAYGTDTFQQEVGDETDECDTLFIPNVITPNHDGKNDYFNIKGLTDPFSLQIYNRWGSKIYETNTSSSLWKPESVSPGTYFYILEVYKGGENRVYKGTVELLLN